MTSKSRAFGLLILATFILMVLAFAGVASAEPVLVHDQQELQSNISAGNDVKFANDITLTSQLEICNNKGLTIDGNYHTLKSEVTGSIKKTDFIHIQFTSKSTTSNSNNKVTLKNLVIDFNKKPGDLNIVDHIKEEQNRFTVELENLTFINMKTDIRTEEPTSPRSAIHVNGANVSATNLTFKEPTDLFTFAVSTIDLEKGDGIPHRSNLTIDKLPYGAHSFGGNATVYQKGSAAEVTLVEPIEIELLFGTVLYLWAPFEKEHGITDWTGLNTTAQKAETGDTIIIKANVVSSGNPETITFKNKGIIINANKTGIPHTINLTDENHGIVVKDLIELASLIGYDNTVVYGDGYVKAGEKLSLEIAGKDAILIPQDTKIQIGSADRTHIDHVNVTLPAETAILPVDEYGIVQIKEGKNVTFDGKGSLTFTNDPRGNLTFLPVNGTLNLQVPVNAWPSLGVNGTGTINIYVKTNAMPVYKDTVTVNVAPFINTTPSHGKIVDINNNPIDVKTELRLNGSSWSLDDDVLTIDGKKYLLLPDSGYKGTWNTGGKISGTIDNARLFTAAFEEIEEQSCNIICTLENTPDDAEITLNLTRNDEQYKKSTTLPTGSKTYTFTDVGKNNVYTLEGRYITPSGNTSSVTKAVTVINDDCSVTLSFPAANVSAEVIKPEKDPEVTESPKVSVDGLDEIVAEISTNPGNITAIVFKTKEEVYHEENPNHQELTAEILRQNPTATIRYLNFTIEENITEIASGKSTITLIPTVSNLISIYIAEDLENKENIQVWQIHGDEMREFERIYSKDMIDDGTYLVDGTKGIYIYSMKFSDYTISSTEKIKPTPYVPSSSGQSGYTEILQETPIATPTPTATPITPDSKPTNLPTSSTSKSPASFAGLIIGLGAAAILLRARK